MSEPLLRPEKVEVTYHRFITAVQGVTLDVPEGAIVALLGTNGAGKTTTLRAISGFIGLDDARVSDGTITYRGERIENRAPHEVTARGIALVPERSKVFENLTVAQNVEVSVGGRGEAVWDYFPALARLRNREAGYLSGGERQMLAIASALACGPRLLLVDELSQGLAPLVVRDLLGRLQQVRRDLGMTMLLVEQNAALALEVADHAYVVENGRIVLDGDPQKLLAHQDIQEFYLGTGGGTGGGTGAGTRKSYRDVKQYRRSRRWYG